MYASCIIDIAHKNVDRCFSYLVPEEIREQSILIGGDSAQVIRELIS